MLNENKPAASAAAPAPAKVKSLPITGTVTLGDGGANAYVSVQISNPFPDEPLEDMRVTFVNPSKTDRWGNPSDDRLGEKRQGLFDFYARKALAGCESLSFTGAVTYRQMMDKRGKSFEFVSIDINSPLPQVGDGEPMRVFIRRAGVQSVFEHLAKERLQLTADVRPGSSLAPKKS